MMTNVHIVGARPNFIKLIPTLTVHIDAGFGNRPSGWFLHSGTIIFGVSEQEERLAWVAAGRLALKNLHAVVPLGAVAT
jgi:hypothetical protein